MLQVENSKKPPQALGFKSLDPVFRGSKQGPCFTAIEEDEGDERLAELKLACKADGIAPSDPLLPLSRQS